MASVLCEDLVSWSHGDDRIARGHILATQELYCRPLTSGMEDRLNLHLDAVDPQIRIYCDTQKSNN
jgi:hypothetical protein